MTVRISVQFKPYLLFVIDLFNFHTIHQLETHVKHYN